MKVPELLQILDEIKENHEDLYITYLYGNDIPSKQFQILEENIKKLELLDILKDFINEFIEFIEDDFCVVVKTKEQYISNKSCRILTHDKYKQIKEVLQDDK